MLVEPLQSWRACLPSLDATDVGILLMFTKAITANDLPT